MSPPLVRRCRDLAGELGLADRCEFLVDALPALAAVPDSSVDAAVLRSVLIYIGDKAAALRALRRVLRPGGRLSLFEPINSFAFPEPAGWLWGFDVTGLEPLAERVKAASRGHHGQPGPMLGFDERDLLGWAEQAGFTGLRLEYQVQVSGRHVAAGTDLATFLRSAPNPLVPTREQLLEDALDPDDRALLTQHIAGQLTTGRGRNREAVAYLSGHP